MCVNMLSLFSLMCMMGGTFGWASSTPSDLSSARSVWNTFQAKCCSGFDDILLPVATQYSSCEAFDLATDYSHLHGVSTDENRINNSIRILFLTTAKELFQQVERSNVNEYAGLCQNDGVVSVLWGVGLQGFNALESIDENVNRWFQDPIFDAIHASHNFYRAVSSAQHGKNGMDLLQDPFSFASTSLLSRATEFASIRSKPVIILSLNELLEKELEELYVSRPHIIYLQYEQHLGASNGGEGGGVFNNCGEPDQGCPLNHDLQEYLHTNQHTLLVHKPHCVSAELMTALQSRGVGNNRSNSGQEAIQDTSSNSNSTGSISRGSDAAGHPYSYKYQALLFGAILYVYYPLRTTSKQPCSHVYETHLVIQRVCPCKAYILILCVFI